MCQYFSKVNCVFVSYFILTLCIASRAFAEHSCISTPQNGTEVTVGVCSYAGAQEWTLPTQVPSKIILKSNTSLCLDYSCDQDPCFSNGHYGPSVFAYDCSDNSPTFMLHDNGTISVAKPSGELLGQGWCLDLRNGILTAQIYPCVGSSNQFWTTNEQGNVLTKDNRCISACSAPQPSYPGQPILHPKIHFTPPYVSMQGGWHDIAGAITHNGYHHIFQGTGWNHAISSDLVHWRTGPHGPAAIHETYAGMDSNTDPCSGFIVKDDDGSICAGFRQCGSNKGVAGMAAWDVPLELRCTTDNVNLSAWTTSPDYLFNVSWWRAIPYDPARPWRESDGNWYQLLSMDGCNDTTRSLPCEAGGQLVMWKSPALRGKDANWQKVGPVFTSNGTVLSPQGGARGHLTKEFVTIDFIGSLPEGPVISNNKIDGLNATKAVPRFFLNNVGGNGGGEGCCAGTTSYFPIIQQEPGAPFEQVGPQSMIDWGAFRFASGSEPVGPTGKGIDLLTGQASRGLSMARTLGSEEDDQVTKTGRRVLIGWIGPADNLNFSGGSAQSLPRDLSLDPTDSSRILQTFVPELQVLRRSHAALVQSSSLVESRVSDPIAMGLQAEFLAFFPRSCGNGNMTCGLSILGDSNGQATRITLVAAQQLVTVDATAQGNKHVRAGPLPPLTSDEKGWTVHVYADHAIIELIVNNATALVVYATPSESVGMAELFGVDSTEIAHLDAWKLASANQI